MLLGKGPPLPFGMIRPAAGWDGYVNFAKAAMPCRNGVAVTEGGT
jgi:hypothetical protein